MSEKKSLNHKDSKRLDRSSVYFRKRENGVSEVIGTMLILGLVVVVMTGAIVVTQSKLPKATPSSASVTDLNITFHPTSQLPPSVTSPNTPGTKTSIIFGSSGSTGYAGPSPSGDEIDVGQSLAMTLSGSLPSEFTAGVEYWYEQVNSGSWILEATNVTTYTFVGLTVGDYDITVASAKVVPTKLANNQYATVTTNSAPSASISPSSAEINVSQVLTLSANTPGGSGIWSYKWTIGGNSQVVGTGSTLIFSEANQGTYNVWLNVTDVGVTIPYSLAGISVPVIVTESPIASISTSASSIDIGQSTTVKLGVSGGTAPYTWTFEYNGSGNLTGSSLDSSGFSFSPTNLGSYNLYFNGTDHTGKVFNTTSIVIVNKDTSTSISASPSLFYAAQTTTITLSISGGTAPYTWTFEYNGSKNMSGALPGSSGFIFTSPGTGNYTLYFNVTDQTGYVSEANTVIEVELTPPPVGYLSGTFVYESGPILSSENFDFLLYVDGEIYEYSYSDFAQINDFSDSAITSGATVTFNTSSMPDVNGVSVTDIPANANYSLNIMDKSTVIWTWTSSATYYTAEPEIAYSWTAQSTDGTINVYAAVYGNVDAVTGNFSYIYGANYNYAYNDSTFHVTTSYDVYVLSLPTPTESGAYEITAISGNYSTSEWYELNSTLYEVSSVRTYGVTFWDSSSTSNYWYVNLTGQTGNLFSGEISQSDNFFTYYLPNGSYAYVTYSAGAIAEGTFVVSGEGLNLTFTFQGGTAPTMKSGVQEFSESHSCYAIDLSFNSPLLGQSSRLNILSDGAPRRTNEIFEQLQLQPGRNTLSISSILRG